MKTFLAVLALCLTIGYAHAQVAAPSAEGHAAVDGPKVNWMSWEQAVAKMEKEPRKIMVDVYTDWCGWCKRMDATTMVDPTVVQILNEKYYAVKMDGEYKKDIVFKGRTYTFKPGGRSGYHELPAELMSGKMSYPTLVFLDEAYGIIQPVPGYQQAPELERILAYFGGDFYKNTSWESFSQAYKSPNAN